MHVVIGQLDMFIDFGAILWGGTTGSCAILREMW
jgi:hypothetical protein